MSGILDSSQQAMSNVIQATGHLNSVSSKIDSGKGTVGALVNDKQLYNNLQSTTASLNETMTHAQAGVTDFQENMEALKHNFFLSGYFKKRGYEDSSELAANRIADLPRSGPTKTFVYAAKQLFDGRDSAKLKNKKALKEAGEFLAQNPFGVAVVVASTGMEGDAKKEQTLTEARAMVIREYLVENFGFDDSLLKTFGKGKQSGANLDSDWGSIQIVIYPAGTPVPAEKSASSESSSATDAARPSPNGSETQKP
jgi:outer membrane protein OmpA-like peptidoglycan-associated protein